MQELFSLRVLAQLYLTGSWLPLLYRRGEGRSVCWPHLARPYLEHAVSVYRDTSGSRSCRAHRMFDVIFLSPFLYFSTRGWELWMRIICMEVIRVREILNGCSWGHSDWFQYVGLYSDYYDRCNFDVIFVVIAEICSMCVWRHQRHVFVYRTAAILFLFSVTWTTCAEYLMIQTYL